MVLDDNVDKGTTLPLFIMWGNLTFDFNIASYTANPFSKLLFIFYSTDYPWTGSRWVTFPPHPLYVNGRNYRL